MRKVSMPLDNWRALHGAVLELCEIWGEGFSLADKPSPLADGGPTPDLLQRVLPVLSVASEWPDVADLEAKVRERFGLYVPEAMLEAARACVQTAGEAE